MASSSSSIAPLPIAKHKDWTPVHAHTARCDYCPQDSLNASVLQRCTICGRQACKNCMTNFTADGDHDGNIDDCDWTPASETKETQAKKKAPRNPVVEPSRRSTRIRIAPVIKREKTPEKKKPVARKPRKEKKAAAEPQIVQAQEENAEPQDTQKENKVTVEPFTKKRQAGEVVDEEPEAKKQKLVPGKSQKGDRVIAKPPIKKRRIEELEEEELVAKRQKIEAIQTREGELIVAEKISAQPQIVKNEKENSEAQISRSENEAVAEPSSSKTQSLELVDEEPTAKKQKAATKKAQKGKQTQKENPVTQVTESEKDAIAESSLKKTKSPEFVDEEPIAEKPKAVTKKAQKGKETQKEKPVTQEPQKEKEVVAESSAKETPSEEPPTKEPAIEKQNDVTKKPRKGKRDGAEAKVEKAEKNPAAQESRKDEKVITGPLSKKGKGEELGGKAPPAKKRNPVARKPRQGKKVDSEPQTVQTQNDGLAAQESQAKEEVVAKPSTKKIKGEEREGEEEPAPTKKKPAVRKPRKGKAVVAESQTVQTRKENKVIAGASTRRRKAKQVAGEESTAQKQKLAINLDAGIGEKSTIALAKAPAGNSTSPKLQAKEAAVEKETEEDEEDENEGEDEGGEKDDKPENRTNFFDVETQITWYPFVPNPAKQVPDKFKGRFVPNYPTADPPVSAERWHQNEVVAEKAKKLAAFREQVAPEFYTNPIIQRYVNEGRMEEALELFKFAQMGMEAMLGL